jgi:hypothetical protein
MTDLTIGLLTDSFREFADALSDFGFADVPEAEH